MNKNPDDYALRRKFTDVYLTWHIDKVGFAPDFAKVARFINPLIKNLAQIAKVALIEDTLECETQAGEKRILEFWENVLNNHINLSDFLQKQFFSLRTLSDYLAQIIHSYKQIHNGNKSAFSNKQTARNPIIDRQGAAGERRIIQHICHLIANNKREYAINKYGENSVSAVERQINTNIS